jgi:hypothetical protein
VTNSAPVIEKRGKSPREIPADRFMFSGHQSFSLRIAWLPKSVDAIDCGVDPFKDPRQGTQILGIGKNMVESLGYWVEFFGVATFGPRGTDPTLTEFGQSVFGKGGFDRFLEDEQTLWLLHWHGTAVAPRRFFAWHWLFTIHFDHEFTYTEALREFKAYSDTLARPLSDSTLRQHLDVFLGTYVASAPTRGAVAEDLLDSPLAVLGLIKENELRDHGRGKDIPYVVDGGPKPTISDEVLRFCLHDWWGRFHANDETTSYRQVCLGENSPGRVFRLPEREVHDRLLRLVMKWPKEFSLTESNNQRLVRRDHEPANVYSTLRQVYDRSA